MQGLLLVGLLLLNFGISWLNAWSVGRSWADSKAVGGWTRVVTWSAAVMSASGFTWCYVILLAIGAGAAGYLPPDYVQALVELGYVIVVFPILGAGLAILIDSLTTAWRRRDLLSGGVAAWNTFAMAHNAYEAASTLPGIFEHLGEVLDGDGDDAKAKLVLLVVVLAVMALVGGALTTAAIVRRTARNYAAEVYADASRYGAPVRARA